jgi:transcriptional regulator with XRE-family HTH domain
MMQRRHLVARGRRAVASTYVTTDRAAEAGSWVSSAATSGGIKSAVREGAGSASSLDSDGCRDVSALLSIPVRIAERRRGRESRERPAMMVTVRGCCYSFVGTLAKLRHIVPTTETEQSDTLAAVAMAPEEVGARIREARLAKGWTHERLAMEMGVGLRTVQRWQTGRNPKDGNPWLPRLATLMRLADVLEVSSSSFVESELDAASVADLAERLEAVERLSARNQAMLAELLQIFRAGTRLSTGERG